MKLLGKLEIKSPQKIVEFCEAEHVGRIASIDSEGYPQVIPMNFVLLGGFIYMHSHIHGEKLDNIIKNEKVGFEIDREFEFLPSYFTHPTDASVADTLYVSVVMKGTAHIISNKTEMCMALNGLMKKYQPEGGYEPVKPTDDTLDYVTVIRITPSSVRGKYKIGQHLQPEARVELARKILKRNSVTAMETLDIMGFAARDGDVIQINDERW
ncbi:MAG: pyridoxamine 5'-phosphate oxidase family protein [Cenarchaeum sp. SB0665_bin_23]|nr:pyridoxamine 5'-phosphate oxidase family protein [Cenarchaeum sp. SB0665_bin_23]MYB46123.1 pyridoxamine 5'-phosphate oxidase family protein [Cenarchaeum sp. SB0662_bin_33]MYG33260.1 pyridoxamine 5'-phosphate oxidase family protein [Cenarchaeum sp. SB0677_bin_16]